MPDTIPIPSRTLSQVILTESVWGAYHYQAFFQELKGLNDLFRAVWPVTNGWSQDLTHFCGSSKALLITAAISAVQLLYSLKELHRTITTPSPKTVPQILFVSPRTFASGCHSLYRPQGGSGWSDLPSECEYPKSRKSGETNGHLLSYPNILAAAHTHLKEGRATPHLKVKVVLIGLRGRLLGAGWHFCKHLSLRDQMLIDNSFFKHTDWIQRKHKISSKEVCLITK